jgi:hypothetical protein
MWRSITSGLITSLVFGSAPSGVNVPVLNRVIQGSVSTTLFPDRICHA